MTYDPVLFSLIRRVYSDTLARNIIGVQPMSGRGGSIFSADRLLRITGDVPLGKEHYKYFLRLNNRKRVQTIETLKNSGYPHGNAKGHLDASDWLRKNLKPGSYIQSYTDIWFARERDHTYFLMTQA